MAKDIYHELTKTALIADGWTITDDPLRSAIGQRQAYIDIGAKTYWQLTGTVRILPLK